MEILPDWRFNNRVLACILKYGTVRKVLSIVILRSRGWPKSPFLPAHLYFVMQAGCSFVSSSLCGNLPATFIAMRQAGVLKIQLLPHFLFATKAFTPLNIHFNFCSSKLFNEIIQRGGDSKNHQVRRGGLLFGHPRYGIPFNKV